MATTEKERNENRALIEQQDADILIQFDRLRELYLGPPEDVEAAYQAYISWQTARIDISDLVKSGDLENAKKSLLPGETAGVYRDTLTEKIEVIKDFSNDKADSLYQSTAELYGTILWQLPMIMVIILVLSILISFLLMRIIQKPLEELTAATIRFQNGDRNARSSYDFTNEFGVLSASFNALAENIQANMELNEKTASFTEVMLEEEDAREFFRKTLNILSRYTNSQIAAAYLFNPQNGLFEHFESIGLGGEGREAFALAGLEGEFGAVLASGTFQRIKDIPEDSRFVFYTVSGKYIPKEIITLPILQRGDVVGVISLASISGYEKKAVDFIKTTVNPMNTRIEGILSYRTIKAFSEKLEQQNRELDAQKNEMEEQSMELLHQNIELEMQKKELNEANRLKTNFLSNMSHELRTPLNSVIALTGILNRRLRDQIPEEEYSYLEVIERNGKNLLVLINDILDISRIEAGREEIEITTFNVNQLIDEVVEMLEPQARQKNVGILNSSCNTKVFLNSDRDKCRHILENLAGNAVKFTEEGKVEITVGQNEENIEIQVKDTGIGIEESQLPFIFDEFRQGDGSTSRRFGGTGLGLAIAKKYANLLGGTVSVKSAVSLGSEFVLSLPLNYGDADRIDETDAKTNLQKLQSTDMHELLQRYKVKPSGSQARKTILLVEDSEPAVIQIRDLLEESGYGIQAAGNAKDAFRIIEEQIPDAMILDLMMPEIDGFEVLKTLREAEVTAHIPVLVLTAKHITKNELNVLTKNNIHQLIQKGDVNKEELLNAVNAMLYPYKSKKKKVTLPPRGDHEKPIILVVEDNEDNMITLKALLEDHFRVVGAFDGSEGIEMAKKYVPDLILMDIALPGIDGIEAFNVIRQTPGLHHVPVIALTASAMTQDREGILAKGFEGFIPKPIIERDFLKVISEVLYGN
jgi:signal transduction histidine kinase/DNA-binding response OmpR family regulator/HAMP domain-containing protein